MTLRSNFSNSINIIFEHNKRSLSEFANELSISRSNLQDILKGNSNPTLATVELIAERLELDPVSLLTYSQDELQITISLSRLLDRTMDLPDEKKKILAEAFSTIIITLVDIKE